MTTQFDQTWDELCHAVRRKLHEEEGLPADTLLPTPAAVAGALYHTHKETIDGQLQLPAWIVDAVETYRQRLWALWGVAFQLPAEPGPVVHYRARTRTRKGTEKRGELSQPLPDQAGQPASGKVHDLEAVSVSPGGYTTAFLTTARNAAGFPPDSPVQLSERLGDGKAALHMLFLGLLPIPGAGTDAAFIDRLIAGFEANALIWESIDGDTRTEYGLKHPLAALIAGCLLRPIDPDDRDTGIMPAQLAASRDIQEAAGTLFDLDAARNAPGAALMDQPGSQAYLPGMQLQTGALIPVLPILLFDQAGLGRRPGRGAPYVLRLWVEALLSVPQDKRIGRTRIKVRFGDLVDWLFPNGGYNAKRDFPALQKAFSIVSNAGIPWGDLQRGGVWSPVRVVNRPVAGNAYNHELILDVDLPPGSTGGPLIYRPILRALSVNSATGYRAMLGLCYLWDRYGATGGRFTQATRPRFARNDDGLFVSENGEVLTSKDGNPIRRYMVGKGVNRRLRDDVVALDADGNRVYSLAQAAREPNPAADKYPILSAAELVQLCYPPIEPNAPAHKLTAASRRSRVQRSIEIVKRMENDGYCLIDGLNDGYRIMPPEGWGAGFSGRGKTGIALG